jgi:hypothetical protein
MNPNRRWRQRFLWTRGEANKRGLFILVASPFVPFTRATPALRSPEGDRRVPSFRFRVSSFLRQLVRLLQLPSDLFSCMRGSAGAGTADQLRRRRYVVRAGSVVRLTKNVLHADPRRRHPRVWIHAQGSLTRRYQPR